MAHKFTCDSCSNAWEEEKPQKYYEWCPECGKKKYVRLLTTL